MQFNKIILSFLIVLVFVACKKETSSETTSNINITITRNGIDDNIEVPATAALINDTMTFIGLTPNKENGFLISCNSFGQNNYKIDLLKNDESHVQNIFVLKQGLDTLTYFGYSGSFNVTTVDLTNNKMTGILISKAVALNIDSLAIDTIEARFAFSDFPILR
jgi:hypothetical protein